MGKAQSSFKFRKRFMLILTFLGAGRLLVLLRGSTGGAAAAGSGLALPAALQAALRIPCGRVSHVSLCLLPEIRVTALY